MNKLFTVLFLSIAYCGISQETTEDSQLEKKHELKIDAVELIAVANIEISYEYLFSKYSGAGLSVTFDGGGESSEDIVKWSITPFYRQYFFNRQEKRAQGLFAEGHLNVGGFEDYYYEYSYSDEGFINSETRVDNDVTAFGVGFGLGYKWASDNGFIIEPLVGVGRNLFGTEENPATNFDGVLDFYFRGGIQVGYRF